MQAKRAVMFGARLLAVCSVALVLTACDVVVGGLNANAKAENQWSRTFPISATGRVEVVNSNGLVEVTATEGNQVEVTAERIANATTDELAREMLKQIEITADASADAVRLETRVAEGSGARRNFKVRYHLKVPATVTLVTRVANGNVEVQGMAGSVTLESTNGTVTGKALAGSVEATTLNGLVDLDMNAVAVGGIKASTLNGRISLALPKGAKAAITATCAHGGIDVDDALKVEVRDENSRRRFEGLLNGGGPKVALDTTNGRIDVTAK